MKEWCRKILSPLTAWHLMGLLWFAQVLLAAAVIVFRSVKTAGIAAAIQFDDVPILRAFDTGYADLYLGLVGGGVATAAVFIGMAWRGCRLGNPLSRERRRQWDRGEWSAVAGIGWFVVFTAATLVACRPLGDETAAGGVHAISWVDWLAVASLAACAWLLPGIIAQSLRSAKPAVVPELRRPISTSLVLRNGMAYLLCAGAVLIYALKDHGKFWDTQANGGFDYRPFFRDGEIASANLVLYSTSALFAAIAAIGACAVISVFRSAVALDEKRGQDSFRPEAAPSHAVLSAEMSPDPFSRDDAGRAISLLSAFAWSAMLSLPWQIKIWPEIAAERGWILPAVTLVFIGVAILPMLVVSRLAMLWDFERRAGRRRERDLVPKLQLGNECVFVPRRSELAVWNFVLFPVYPLIRWARAGGATLLFAVISLASGAAIVAATWAANKADAWYTFDDWQGMLKSGQFPFLQVAFSLLCACFAYVLLRRLVLLVKAEDGMKSSRLSAFRLPPSAFRFAAAVARPVVLLLVLASLVAASWPFWGWKKVSENTFTRLSEYSNRHIFELTFLHWLFDFDRDGYAAVLHGADPDDFDATVLPAYLDPPRDDNAVPIDRFAIADRSKAREFPNLVILFLEGVTPKSISAYGQRQVVGTPHMDAIAREGTVFTQARCFYPSTWDAWFSIVSGRYLRVKEFDMSRPFGNRYSRYNNLYRVLALAGVNRWCHADTPPYLSLLVSEQLRKSKKTAWMPNFDSSVSTEDEQQGVWRGDKRNERMLKFLDDLKPGDKFFLCEHMSDTHFPWKSIKGLEWASDDAVLHNGARDGNYSNYFQTITRMDQQVGRLVRKLKDKGLYDNTAIVIVSDHGCQWWEHEHMYYVSHLYDQCLLVPMIVRLPPGSIAGRKRGQDSFRGRDAAAISPRHREKSPDPFSVRKVDTPVLQLDLLATFMELAGVKHANPRDDYPLPSRSLLPLMTGTATPQQIATYRDRDVPLTTHHAAKLGVLAGSRYKLIFHRPSGTYKLFDLKNDPREMVNLVDDRPDLLQDMLEKLRRLIRENPAIIGGIKAPDDEPPASKPGTGEPGA
jgi:arylsulfatase A-like enzyme